MHDTRKLRYLLEESRLEPDGLLVGEDGERVRVDGARALVCALLRALLRVLQPRVLTVLLLHPVAHHVAYQRLTRQD